eukprot:scaffold1.g5811.t1
MSQLLTAAFARAVADQIGQGNVQPAAEAITAALTLAGGPGPAQAMAAQLEALVQSVGCSSLPADTLRAATDLLAGQSAPYAGRGQSFAYSVAQQSGVSGCWTTVGGAVAGGLLSSIQPVFVVAIGPAVEGATPVGAVAPTTTALPPPGASGAQMPAATAPAAVTNVAAPGQQAPTPGAAAPTSPELAVPSIE